MSEKEGKFKKLTKKFTNPANAYADKVGVVEAYSIYLWLDDAKKEFLHESTTFETYSFHVEKWFKKWFGAP